MSILTKGPKTPPVAPEMNNEQSLKDQKKPQRIVKTASKIIGVDQL